MTIRESLQLFKNMATQVTGTRRDHAIVDEAINTMEAYINVHETKSPASKKRKENSDTDSNTSK